MQSWAARLNAIRARARLEQDYLDFALAVALAGGVLSVAVQTGARLDALSLILLLGQTLPLAVRRRDPIRVLVVTGVSIGVYSGFGYPEVGGNLGPLIAFYTVAAHRSRRTVAVAAAFCGIGVFETILNYSSYSPAALQQVFAVYLEYIIAWLVGDYVRVRRLYIAELEERATRLEREREDRARQAVIDERLRIARELHDVVAHHVSVMVVQSAAARRVIDANPALARESLESVEDAGRTALAEMRRMLEVLRAQQPGRSPQPRLDEIEGLVGQVRDVGLPVELEIEGEQRAVPAGIDLAAYRIVQEALTNVVKHAGPKARATVHLTYEARALLVEVEDDGRGAAAALQALPDGGHGLIGMRERVALYGGTLEVGARASGGFRVQARLPIPATESATDRRSTLAATADATGGTPGVPSGGNVYPWPEYP